MYSDQTLCIIKPTAVKNGDAIHILSDIVEAGFKITRLKLKKLNKEEAAEFYSVHKDKFFYNDLIEYMSSGEVVIACLEKVNAIEDFRKLMGDTDPQMAEENTLRKKYGISKQKNAVHGSDSPENAKREINFFFKE